MDLIRVEYFIAAAPERTTEFSPYSVIRQAAVERHSHAARRTKKPDTSLGTRVGRAQRVIEPYDWKGDPASAAAPRPSTGKSSPARCSGHESATWLRCSLWFLTKGLLRGCLRCSTNFC